MFTFPQSVMKGVWANKTPTEMTQGLTFSRRAKQKMIALELSEFIFSNSGFKNWI